MTYIIKFILALLLLSFFASCGSLNIEKRKHTKGFYLSSAKTNQKVEKPSANTLFDGKDKIENSSLAITGEKNLVNPIIIDSTISDKNKFCDTIVMRNGVILSVHILEKTDSTLMYSLCEGEDDSEVIIPIENVKLIKYKEGKYDVMSQKMDSSKKNKDHKPKKEENTFVFVLLSIFGSIGLTILAGFLLVLAAGGTSGLLLYTLVFLIVAFSFYLFLLMIFRNKEKPKFLLIYALIFGLPFGIISYFLFK